MGIFVKQWAVAMRSKESEMFDQDKSLPLMTRADADAVAQIARSNGLDVVVINTLSE